MGNTWGMYRQYIRVIVQLVCRIPTGTWGHCAYVFPRLLSQNVTRGIWSIKPLEDEVIISTFLPSCLLSYFESAWCCFLSLPTTTPLRPVDLMPILTYVITLALLASRTQIYPRHPVNLAGITSSFSMVRAHMKRVVPTSLVKMKNGLLMSF
jgi:hypothetical protein